MVQRCRTVENWIRLRVTKAKPVTFNDSVIFLFAQNTRSIFFPKLLFDLLGWGKKCCLPLKFWNWPWLDLGNRHIWAPSQTLRYMTLKVKLMGRFRVKMELSPSQIGKSCGMGLLSSVAWDMVHFLGLSKDRSGSQVLVVPCLSCCLPVAL